MRTRFSSIAALLLLCWWPSLPAQAADEQAAAIDQFNADARLEPCLAVSGAQMYRSVTYGLVPDKEGGQRQLRLHVFLPPGHADSNPPPTVVWFHGGSFRYGTYAFLEQEQIRGFAELGRRLLSEGFAVVSVEYRLIDEAPWPAQVQDGKAALRFLHARGRGLGIDPDRIALMGHSAGSRLTCMVALMADTPHYVGDHAFRDTPLRPAALVPIASSLSRPPQADFDEMAFDARWAAKRVFAGGRAQWDAAARRSLEESEMCLWITPACPPIFTQRGELDYAGDHSSIERSNQQLRAWGVDARLAIIPGGGHNARAPDDETVAFLKQHLEQAPVQRPRVPIAEIARDLIDAGLFMVARFQLSQALGGYDAPGHWVMFSSGEFCWRLDPRQLPDGELSAMLMEVDRVQAGQELSRAAEFAANGQWQRVALPAENAIAMDPNRQQLAEALIAESRQALSARQQQLEERGGIPSDTFPSALPAWASSGGVDGYGPWLVVDLGEGVHMRFRPVPADPEQSIPEGLWLAETECTREQWSVIAGTGMPNAEDALLPQVNTDYQQIAEWIETLARERPGLGPRLPRQSEWLAAVAPDRLRGFASLDAHAVHAGVVEVGVESGVRPVGERLPGPGGFYDAIGNVEEWTCSPGPVVKSLRRVQLGHEYRRLAAYPIAVGWSWATMPHMIRVREGRPNSMGNRTPLLGFRLLVGASDGGPRERWWRHLEP